MYDARIEWVKITAPSGNAITANFEDGVWEGVAAGNYIILESGQIETGQSYGFTLNVQTGDNLVYGDEWTIEASIEPAGGGSIVGCSIPSLPRPTDVSVPTSAPATVAATPASTSVPTPTPTPTPKVDRTPPVVSVTTEFAKPFEKAPTISGKASDDEELYSVEYSVDGGKNWLPVDEFDGKAEKKGSWEFTPGVREDGDYGVVVRAKDKTGNVGESGELNLVIDRLPPRVGGALWSVGPFALVPGEDGKIVTIAGVEVRVTVPGVGGPIRVKFEVRNAKLEAEEEVELERSVDTGLWSAVVGLEEEGEYELEVLAVDGANNETRRAFGTVDVLRPGRVEGGEGGRLELFWQDPESGGWTSWDGVTFGQTNPVYLGAEGEYRLLIPAGRYYLEVKAPGYKTLRTRIFSVNNITPLNANFILNKLKWRWWGWWGADLVELELGRGEGGEVRREVAERAGEFSLPTTLGTVSLRDLIGEPAVVSFVNTWSPTGSEQISVLDRLLYERQIEGVMVVPVESLAGVKVFARRGGYKSSLAVDADGEWVEKYGLTVLPAHFFLDRNGVVTKRAVGVLNKAEILQLMAGN